MLDIAHDGQSDQGGDKYCRNEDHFLATEPDAAQENDL